MKKYWKKKRMLLILGSGFLLGSIGIGNTLKSLNFPVSIQSETKDFEQQETENEQKDYIKWVDFNVCYQALEDAYLWDVKTHEQEVELHWIPLLAYLACRNGGDFSDYHSSDMDTIAEVLINHENTLEELTKDKKYYSYYLEAYTAVLGGMVGTYEIQIDGENGEKIWETKYGLKAFSPIAKGFEYYDYDDFGKPRAYGYSRPHLGHDMMGQIGTPIKMIY